MSDEHDSWFKDAFGVDLGDVANRVKDEASAVITQAQNTVTQAVQTVGGAVETAVDGAMGAVGGVVSAAAGVVKKAASAAGVPGVGPAPVEGGGTGSFPLGGSVGRGGKNAPSDVRAVQSALGLGADGQCGPQTIAAIETYQRNMGQAKPDGRVDAGGATERAMSSGARPAATPSSPPAAAGDDDSGGLFDQVKKGAEGLLDGAKDLGGKVVSGAEGLLEDAKDLGGKAIAGAEGLLDDAKKLAEEGLGGVAAAAQGVLGDSGGALLGDVTAAGGLQLSGKFHHELPETKFAEFPASSYLRGSLKYKSEITAEIVKDGKGGGLKFTGTTNLGGKAEIDLAKQKADDFSNETLRDVLKTLNVKEIKESLSIEISAKKIDITISITATIGSASVSWINGVVKGKFSLLSAELEKIAKDPNDFALTAVGVEGGAQGENVIPMDSIGIPGYGLGVKVTGVVSFSVGPNWGRILGDAAKKAVEQGAKEAGKQLVKGGEIAAIDIAVTAGLILVAIGVVVGSAHELAVAGEERQLVANVTGARNQFETGLFTALKGEPKPVGGWPAKGWEAGNQVFQQALSDAEEKNPDLLPDEVRQKAINACLTVSKNQQIQPRITRKIGQVFWTKWVAGHHGNFDTASQAKLACGICFNRAVTSVDDPDMQEWVQASK